MQISVIGCFVAWHFPPRMVTDRTTAPTDNEEGHTAPMLTKRTPVEAILATSSRFSIEPSLGTGTGSEVVAVVREGKNAYRVTTRDGCQQMLDEATLKQLPQGVARLATLQTRELMAPKRASKYQSGHKEADLDKSSAGHHTAGTAETQERVVFVFGFLILA